MTSPGPSDVSVVICCYTMDRVDMLTDAIHAASSQHPHEVLVVVDHNDELFDYVTSLEAVVARLRTTSNVGPRGLSGARNSGVDLATGSIVVFLDDDAVPRSDWLTGLCAPLGSDDIVGVGGNVSPDWAERRPDWFPPEFYWVVGCSYRGQATGIVRNPIGANMAFRRSALIEAGGFRSDLGRVGTIPLGCEETELGLRVSRLGLGSCVVVEDATVDHHVPASRCERRYFFRRCYAEGISKAAVRRWSGGTPALGAERSHVRLLASSVGASMRRAATTRSIEPLDPALMIASGTVAAAAGYVTGMVNGAVRTGTTRTGTTRTNATRPDLIKNDRSHP